MEVWVTYYDFGKKKTVRELRTIDDLDSVNLPYGKRIELTNEEGILEKSETRSLIEQQKEMNFNLKDGMHQQRKLPQQRKMGISFERGRHGEIIVKTK